MAVDYTCKLREATARVERYPELIGLLGQAVLCIENANSGAFANGNRAENGIIDEGEVMTERFVDGLHTYLHRIEPNRFQYDPPPLDHSLEARLKYMATLAARAKRLMEIRPDAAALGREMLTVLINFLQETADSPDVVAVSKTGTEESSPG